MATATYKAPTSLPTVFDAAFKGAGQREGLEVWRIEKFVPVKKAPSDPAYQGQLFTGDSYIFLQTKKRGDALERHIFFWLGGESSQDEYGCAAYKTVELDASLGGEPVQHREVQGFETVQFLALFKNGVSYVAGGAESGFRHVDREQFTTRLLHVKGRRNVRVFPVELSPKSMNVGDVFILDAGRDIYVWNGSESSRIEKTKALDIARKIRDEERGGKARLSVVDQNGDERDFWTKFGVMPTKILAPATDDDAFVRSADSQAKLLRISDASGRLAVTEVGARPLTQAQLGSGDAYILDVGNALAGLFVWVGKGASPSEKLHSMTYAVTYCRQKNYPAGTPITRVVEGGETPVFKQYFAGWAERNATAQGGLARPQMPAGRRFEKKSFDVKAMYRKQEREKAQLIDDGKGSIDVWRIEHLELVPVEKRFHGQFYQGDSYVVLYTYNEPESKRERHIIYFWQGLSSSIDEKAASAIHSAALDAKYGGEPVQVRVTQGKEPPHFHAMFQGRLVIHQGGHASGFRNTTEKDSYDVDGTRLFQVRGTTASNVRAVQVPERAASLNSGDVFLLETPKAVYLWCGAGATGDEREYAKTVVKAISPKDYTLLLEGKEPADFWAALGGKTEYANFKNTDPDQPEPRLFQISNARGYLFAEEIFDFTQEDLIEEDVMMLDAQTEIFLWVGAAANADERKGALQMVFDYLRADPAGRTEHDVAVIQIKQGFEPPSFTCHFGPWSAAKWSQGNSYAELKAMVEASNPRGSLADVAPVSARAALTAMTSTTYPYSMLIAANPPEGVDVTCKERYLSDAEFTQVFGMTRAEFAVLPAWKAINKKKQVKLF